MPVNSLRTSERLAARQAKSKELSQAHRLPRMEKTSTTILNFFERVYCTMAITYSLANLVFADPVTSQHLTFWMLSLGHPVPIPWILSEEGSWSLSSNA